MIRSFRWIGITNYRRTQERDLFWRRFRYAIVGIVTIGLILLLIILSIISKRASSPSQSIDIRLSHVDISTSSSTSSSLTNSHNTFQRALMKRFLRGV